MKNYLNSREDIKFAIEQAKNQVAQLTNIPDRKSYSGFSIGRNTKTNNIVNVSKYQNGIIIYDINILADDTYRVIYFDKKGMIHHDTSAAIIKFRKATSKESKESKESGEDKESKNYSYHGRLIRSVTSDSEFKTGLK